MDVAEGHEALRCISEGTWQPGPPRSVLQPLRNRGEDVLDRIVPEAGAAEPLLDVLRVQLSGTRLAGAHDRARSTVRDLPDVREDDPSESLVHAHRTER